MHLRRKAANYDADANRWMVTLVGRAQVSTPLPGIVVRTWSALLGPATWPVPRHPAASLVTWRAVGAAPGTEETRT